MGRRRKNKIVENITLESYATEGKAIGRKEGKVFFVENGVPGDLVDIWITKNKKDYAKAKVHKIITPSAERITPFCNHFEWCGGCKWQFLSYEKQARYKQQIVIDTLERVGKLKLPKSLPIVAADQHQYYRNKMEYSFSNKRWLTPAEIESEEHITQTPALGMHVPGFFDKIVDIEHCYLQHNLGNQIRNAVKQYALKNNLSFYDIQNKEGLLRTMFIRNTTLNEWMVIVTYFEPQHQKIIDLLEFLEQQFPQITSFHYVHNSKANDTIFDQKVEHWKGKGFINEQMDNLTFKISPKSFFQTNTYQAIKLYEVVKQFAELKTSDVLYDLYSGTGTIGLYLAQYCKTVIGIESNEDSVKDATINQQLNNIENAHFYAGEVREQLQNVLNEHGPPNVVVIDPPRAGLHKMALELVLQTQATKIVYVSCNPATQARDLSLMVPHYNIQKFQPVDMFPHTYHIENVVLLKKSSS